jgi:hypothetical protein
MADHKREVVRAAAERAGFRDPTDAAAMLRGVTMSSADDVEQAVARLAQDRPYLIGDAAAPAGRLADALRQSAPPPQPLTPAQEDAVAREVMAAELASELKRIGVWR